MRERILGPLARRWAWFATAMRVEDRYEEVHGNHLAAAVTLTAFLSLFPLLLAAIGVIGIFSREVADFPGQVIARLGIADPTARTVLIRATQRAQQSGRAASVVGFAGLLWSGLTLVGALQFAFDSAWQVAGRGLKDRLYGLGWLAGASVVLIASTALTAGAGRLPLAAAPLAVVATVVVDVALWLWAFKVLTNRDVGWRPLLPGAVVGGVGLELLKLVGSFAVPRAVASSSALYGSIGVVFAILAWLLFFGRLAVYAAVVNVVRWEEDHGTVTAEIELPREPGAVAVMATRAGEAQPRPAS